MGRAKHQYKSKNVLSRQLSLIQGCDTNSSTKKKDSPNSFDLIFHSSGKTRRSSQASSRSNSTQIKKVNGFLSSDIVINDFKNIISKKKVLNEHKQNKNRDILEMFKEITINNRKKILSEDNTSMIIEEEGAVKKKSNIKKFKSPKKIYTKENLGFENESNGEKVYIKKFKEDDIPFTKSKILPEIEEQDIDNDVLTSDEQKKSAFNKEMNWLTEEVKKIQNDENYLKKNVYMIKMAKKYPSNI